MNAPEQLILLEPSPTEAVALADTAFNRAARLRVSAEMWRGRGFDALAVDCIARAEVWEADALALAAYGELGLFAGADS